MLLRYEWRKEQKVVRPSGMEVVGFRCDPWRWYRGEEGEYI
jgi:hypothetical protein